MLVEQRVAHARLARHGAHIRLTVAGNDAEDRRLAGAVTPNNPPPFALGDGERDVLEQFGGSEGDTDVGAGEKSHAAMKATGGRCCLQCNRLDAISTR
ncbi:hypothetical protein [Gemmatimonas sp.]|uniref:hypothetical protein n=1 Tax=Gemmatimonas sp. TaxID=1962908 RepID=UPI003DA38E39